MWVAVTGGLLWVAWSTQAAWYWIALMPFLALYLVNGTFVRHTSRMAARASGRGRARNDLAVMVLAVALGTVAVAAAAIVFMWRIS
jgi:hypothetical protein